MRKQIRNRAALRIRHLDPTSSRLFSPWAVVLRSKGVSQGHDAGLERRRRETHLGEERSPHPVERSTTAHGGKGR